MNFKIEKKIDGGLGRAGIVETASGSIQTPAFVPVATKASVKALIPEIAKELGAQVVLGNTYHLYLQPGEKIVKKAGGIAEFMNWSGPIMTDSGGFQVFSLGTAYGKGGISKVVKTVDPRLLIPERFDDSDAPRLAEIGNDGVSFKSHLDGSLHYITPEKSIQIQHNLGADIIFAFDECTSPTEDLRYQKEALARTHAWAKRSLQEHEKLNQADKVALFGVVQGGRNEELRRESALFLSKLDFNGFGIGGSFEKADIHSAVRWVNEILPEDKPRHLLGIGEPEDLLMGIEAGVDLFDCVAPTRNGRNGTLYTKFGKINIKGARYKEDFSPIEDSCQCYTCKNYTSAYLNHLFRGKEMLAGTLGSVHNLYFIINLVDSAREAIMSNNFHKFKEAFLKNYNK